VHTSTNSPTTSPRALVRGGVNPVEMDLRGHAGDPQLGATTQRNGTPSGVEQASANEADGPRPDTSA